MAPPSPPISRFRRLAVFCGASPGSGSAYVAAAVRTAEALAERGIDIVYGGGTVGLMGALADAALARGAYVTGVIPRALMDRELGNTGVTELLLVDSMHERKAIMNELSDGFVGLPGGFGTLEEVFEILSWMQLGLHDKPTGLLNVDGFFNSLRDFLDHAAGKELLAQKYRDAVIIEDDVDTLLSSMAAWEPPDRPMWVQRVEQT